MDLRSECRISPWMGEIILYLEPTWQPFYLEPAWQPFYLEPACDSLPNILFRALPSVLTNILFRAHLPLSAVFILPTDPPTHTHKPTPTHTHTPDSGVQFLVLAVRTPNLHVNQQGAQFQLFVVLVPQRDGAKPGPQRGDGERGCTNEVRVSKDVLVLCNESDEGQLWVEDFEFAALVPDGIEPVVLCGKCVC